jgi:hypothetical protein
MDILSQLRYPFDPKMISWRVGSTTKDKAKGMALAYIDARDVMRRFDLVMGADWQCDYTHCGPQGVICRVGLKIDGEWRWRANGAGETDYEATKGAMSDAFKRAAVLWGVGQYLYDLGSPWVTIEAKGTSYVIPKGQEPALPAWATPAESLESILGKASRTEDPAIPERVTAALSAIEKGDWLACCLMDKGDDPIWLEAWKKMGSKDRSKFKDLQTMRDKYREGLNALATDEHGFAQFNEELTAEQARYIYRLLTPEAQTMMTNQRAKAA